MIKELSEIDSYFKEMDVKFPNRHKEIHKSCCKNCPSKQTRLKGIEDVESKEMKDSYNKAGLIQECLFVCAWRNNKLCKGICDYFDITQEDINKQLSH
jgi:hypothetical protein